MVSLGIAFYAGFTFLNKKSTEFMLNRCLFNSFNFRIENSNNFPILNHNILSAVFLDQFLLVFQIKLEFRF